MYLKRDMFAIALSVLTNSCLESSLKCECQQRERPPIHGEVIKRSENANLFLGGIPKMFDQNICRSPLRALASWQREQGTISIGCDIFPQRKLPRISPHVLKLKIHAKIQSIGCVCARRDTLSYS